MDKNRINKPDLLHIESLASLVRKGENLIKKPQILENLRSYTRACVLGRETILYLSLGLLIRILLAPWTEQRFDSYVSRLWCALVYGYNSSPFDPSLPAGYSYPPVWLFTTLSLFPIWWGITGFKFPQSPTSLWKYGVDIGNIFEGYRSFIPPALPLLDMIMKLPNILADIGIGYLLINLAQDAKYKKAVLFFWILNPYTIQISSIWGQFDPLCTFFTFCSVYLLWRGKPVLSALFLSLGIGTKLYPIFFSIPILIYLHKKSGLRQAFEYFIASTLFGGIIFYSFVLFPDGLEFIRRLFILRASPDWYGKNFVSGLTWTYFLTIFQWNGNLPIFPLIFAPVYLWLNYTFWRAKNDFDALVTCLVSILLLVYLSYTVVYPHYAFWVLPFLLYLAVRGKFPKKLYTIFSSIPLIYIYGRHNPLYFISPAIVWDAHNCPPWSDVIRQLWPIIFNDLAMRFLSICMFPIISLLSLLFLVRSSTRIEVRSLIPAQVHLSTGESHQSRGTSILYSWREKLGIETGRDLLIFLVFMGVAITALIIFAFAGLGYIIPFPY